MSASIMSDICSIIILFLPLMPYYLTGKPSGHINHRKQNFLLYASLLHFFTLCLRLTGFLINASGFYLGISHPVIEFFLYSFIGSL